MFFNFLNQTIFNIFCRDSFFSYLELFDTCLLFLVNYCFISVEILLHINAKKHNDSPNSFYPLVEKYQKTIGLLVRENYLEHVRVLDHKHV